MKKERKCRVKSLIQHWKPFPIRQEKSPRIISSGSHFFTSLESHQGFNGHLPSVWLSLGKGKPEIVETTSIPTKNLSSLFPCLINAQRTFKNFKNNCLLPQRSTPWLSPVDSESTFSQTLYPSLL